MLQSLLSRFMVPGRFLSPDNYILCGKPATFTHGHAPTVNLDTSQSKGGSFAFRSIDMPAKDGRPSRKCGGSKWYKNGKCATCGKAAQHKRYHDDPERHQAAAREYRQRNPEKTKEANRQSWLKHRDRNLDIGKRWRRENPEKAKASTQNWRRNNQERLFESGRNRRQRDREKINENNRRWKKENPAKIRAFNHRRETRKTEAGGSYTAAEWNALVDHFGGKCLRCGRDDVPLTVDHIIL